MTIHKHTERKQETVEKEIIDSVECDLCHKEFKNAHANSFDGEVEWEWLPDVSNTTVTAISRKTGFSYPEGGHTERSTWHICPECFDMKLVPWLKQQGAEPTKTESDY